MPRANVAAVAPRNSRTVIRHGASIFCLIAVPLVFGCMVAQPKPVAPEPAPLEDAGKLHEDTQVHRTPGRTETTTTTKPVTKMVTRYEYKCRSVSRPVTKTETRYEYRYDYTTKSSRSVPVTRTVTRYEYRNECRSEPVYRSETTYETKTQSRYVPPREHVTKVYSKQTVLIEAEPEVLISPHHRAR